MSVLTENALSGLISHGAYQNPLIVDSLDPVVASSIALLVVIVYASSVAYRRVGTEDGWSVKDLESEEQNIVNLLENNKGRIEQKLISDEMEWSDAKTSRLTSSLIDKEVVDKVRDDRQNYVILKDDNRSEEDI